MTAQPHDIDHMAPVMGADGEFHAQDEAVDLSGTPLEAWVALGFFWILGATVFYQFFTRYVLNDSAAWTEEIARYLLICIVFVTLASAVRRTRHIHVDFLYRLIPAKAGRALSTVIDIMRTAFFAMATGLTIQMMLRMGSLQMTVVDLPVNLVYGVCAFGFAASTIRSVQVAVENWRRGWSLLERPEYAIEEIVR
jgi:TRAP-type transport system small permease protein